MNTGRCNRKNQPVEYLLKGVPYLNVTKYGEVVFPKGPLSQVKPRTGGYKGSLEETGYHVKL